MGTELEQERSVGGDNDRTVYLPTREETEIPGAKESGPGGPCCLLV